jgi:hypothetical protein
MPRDVLLTAIHENAGGLISSADLEMGAADEKLNEKKEKKEKNDGVKA